MRVAENGTQGNIGTDSATYTPTAADHGHHVKVVASFTDGGGNAESRTSDQTYQVMPAATTCPASGVWCAILTVGQAGNESNSSTGFRSSDGVGSLTDATFTHRGVEYTVTLLVAGGTSDLFFSTTPNLPSDGAGLTIHVQQYAGDRGLPLSDAVFSASQNWFFWQGGTYTLPSEPLNDTSLLQIFTRFQRVLTRTDIGTEVRVRLSGTDSNNPAFGQPVITGTLQAGETLTAAIGDITDDDGLPGGFPGDYSFQWVRVDGDGVSNPEEIPGAVSEHYTLTEADANRKIRVRVSFTDGLGNAETVQSDAYPSDGTTGGSGNTADDQTVPRTVPRAWLAHFGRTVAEQVLEAVGSRLRTPPRSETEIKLAGYGVGTAGEEEEPARDGRSYTRGLTGRELLADSAFSLDSVWGRGTLSRFDGREGELVLDGEVSGAMLGADWTRERWTTGLMLNHARGKGAYRGTVAGTVRSTVNGLYPYGRYALTDRVDLWGVAGYGTGTLILEPREGAELRTDMDLAMMATGLRGVAVKAPPEGGPELSVEADVLAVRTDSDESYTESGRLASATGDALRLRLGLEGIWRGLELAGGKLSPRLEVGIRRDGGDAETGFGLDAGAGVVWLNASRGIRVQLSGRGSLHHGSEGFRVRGMTASLSWRPNPAGSRGPELTLAQSLGESAAGGISALLSRRTLPDFQAGGDDDPLDNRQLSIRFGYGFMIPGGRFLSTPGFGYGLSDGQREYRLDWRLDLARRLPGALELGLEAIRREEDRDATPENAVGLSLTARW